MGANLNAITEKGTPLTIAVNRGQHDVFDLFLKAGADINGTTKDGETALILAIKKDPYANSFDTESKREFIEPLLKAGADINLTN